MTRILAARILQVVGVVVLLGGALTLCFACSPANTADAHALLRGGAPMAGLGAVFLLIGSRLARTKTSERPVEP